MNSDIKVEHGNFMYDINIEDKTASIVRHTSITALEAMIPRTIMYKSTEYTIISILTSSFSFSPVKTLKFAENSEIHTIEKHAFMASSIESISIPSSLTDLNDACFMGCPYLTKIEVDPNNPRYLSYEDKFIIGKSSLESENYDVLVFCVRNIEKVTIPNFIKSIGSYAFEVCQNLQTVEFQIDSKLQLIDKFAFSHSSIESITIPSNCVEIKKGWCAFTLNLTKIFLHKNNPMYSCIDDKILIKKSSTTLINYDILVFGARNIESIIIPSSIKIIDKYAFHYCKKLKAVEFSKNSELQLIDESAFSSSSIESFIFPSKICHIDKYAFSACNQLRKISIPNNSELKTIGESAFSASSIESFVVTSNITYIYENAFNSCKYLKIIEIDENAIIKSIDIKMFEQCNQLIIMISEKIKEILY